jgi:hypothetical protein
MSACTDWTSYAEINRPIRLIIKALTLITGAIRFGPVISSHPETIVAAPIASDNDA